MERLVDNFGRVVLPKELREILKITEYSVLDLTVQSDSIVVKNVGESRRGSVTYFSEQEGQGEIIPLALCPSPDSVEPEE